MKTSHRYAGVPRALPKPAPRAAASPASPTPPPQVHRRWSFWLIISVVCAFTIVVVYFAWRGFRAHWRGAAAVAAERESELAARPPAFPHGDLDAAELARRTGRSSGDVAAKLLLRKESAAAQPAAAAAADAVA
jgi:hypothetical protein